MGSTPNPTTSPLGVPGQAGASTPSGIDQVTVNSPSVFDQLNSDVERFLKGGQTAKPNRANETKEICPDTAPGYSAPQPGQNALVVTISPNSPGSAATAVSNPNLFAADSGDASVYGGFIQAIGLNLSRSQLTLQNVSTKPILMRFGQPNDNDGADSYHLILKAASSSTAGDGGAFITDLWKGSVWLLGTSGAVCSVIEMQEGAIN